MSGAPARLLVLGIDAASPDLLDAWIADGTLPNLAALAARGLTGRTRGLDGFFVGSTWPSLYTGANPAQHGFHYQTQLVSGSYRLEDRTRGAFVVHEPLWRVLSRAGKRVAVLDVPLSKLEAELNGVQVVEWGAHDAFFGHSTLPIGLASQIEALAGRHPVSSSCDAIGRSVDEYRAFVSALQLGVRRKAQWSTALLARGGWDLFMQVFTEAHCVGHQCWHIHDPAHPAHDASAAASIGDPLRLVYAAIDRAVGELVDTAGDARILVFSSHGMSHRHGAHFLLPDLLCALGVAVRPTISSRDRVRGMAHGMWHVVPAWLRSLLRPLRRLATPDAIAGPHGSAMGADPARSHCFPLSNGLAVSGIRLNLVGREPRGLITPGEEELAFLSHLERELLAIVDDATGMPLVNGVRRTRDLYAGEHLDALPDLLVEWSESAAVGSTVLGNGTGARVCARSPSVSTVEGANDYGRSGEHRAEGWFVAAGPGITRGRLERRPSVLDLAPTIARILGVQLPGVDGQPIAEIAD